MKLYYEHLKAYPWLSSFQLLTVTLDNEATTVWEALGQECMYVQESASCMRLMLGLPQ